MIKYTYKSATGMYEMDLQTLLWLIGKAKESVKPKVKEVK